MDMVSKNVDSNHSTVIQNYKRTGKTHRLPIVLSGVGKTYGAKSKARWALREINLTIEPGVFGLLGRNGAGKTTLLQILSTLLLPTEGNIHIGPYDALHQRWKVRSLMGFLPQDQGFYPRLTVKETLRYMAALQGLERPEQHITQVLEDVNLADQARSLMGTLSGGMRRRVGLAQALLGDLPIIIVDEPTAGLDPVEQQRFRMLLGSLAAHGDRTIILSTHIVADIATIAHRLAVLEKGQIVFQGTVGTLTEQARGRCWAWRTSIDRIDVLRQDTSLLVSSLSPVTDGTAAPNMVNARIIGDHLPPEAELCEPTLEDGYFSIIGARENDDHA